MGTAGIFNAFMPKRNGAHHKGEHVRRRWWWTQQHCGSDEPWQPWIGLGPLLPERKRECGV